MLEKIETISMKVLPVIMFVGVCVAAYLTYLEGFTRIGIKF